MIVARPALMVLLASPVHFSAPLGPPPGVEPFVLHVDDDAGPGGSGLGWSDAFVHLQDALSAARAQPSVKEIRVAQGLYRPDLGQGVEPGDVYARFELVDGVALRGGYAGIMGRDPDSRNVESLTSILSGDLLGDDAPGFQNVQDNAYRVVYAADLGPTALFEGFFVTGSQWQLLDTWTGGGLYCASGHLTVQACSFSGNLGWRGGGLAVEAGMVVVRQCRFTNNRAYFGAGISTHAAPGYPSVVIEDCLFVENECQFEDGGGIRAGPRTLIRRCTFERNTADDGGAIQGARTTNSTTRGPMVEQCTFFENAADYGGAVQGSGTYRRCVFKSNYADTTGGAYAGTHPTANDARFIECTFLDNTTGSTGTGGAASGGALFLSCRFLGNRSGWSPASDGGALELNKPSSIVNCAFSGNEAGGAGGAIHIGADVGTSVINCTFANNGAGGTGAAIHGPVDLINTVIWSRVRDACIGLSSASYSCVPMSCSELGPGNIVADPVLLDPEGTDGIAGTDDDDLRLANDSPCIDAADSTALPVDAFDLDGDHDYLEPLPLDIAGNARILDTVAVADSGIADPVSAAIVDMGAHEHRPAADIVPRAGSAQRAARWRR